MFQVFISLALVGLVVSSWSPTLKALEDVRIVGGEDIDITEAPYQVSLVNRGRHSCGGTIIGRDVIVTAAHCVIGTSASDFKIRAGSSSSDTGGELYQVGEVVQHPHFSYTKMDSDIALLWLSKPIEFNDKASPIGMYEEDEEINDGVETIVTGWGHTREGGGFPSTLQRVLVPKVNEQVCNAAYFPSYVITSTMLCAGAPTGGKDACQGDSGGPLVYNGRLAGVVSWGLGCARPDYPGVYAKISALRTWINDNIAYLRMKNLLRGL